MMRRIRAWSGVLLAAVSLQPGIGTADTATTYSAPYNGSRDGNRTSCHFANPPTVQCVGSVRNEPANGEMSLDLLLDSDLPMVAGTWGQPELAQWGIPVSAGHRSIEVIVTIELDVARVWHSGTVARATEGRLVRTFVDAALSAGLRQDCHIEFGCLEDPCPLGCGVNIIERILDVSQGVPERTGTLTLRGRIENGGQPLPAGELNVWTALYGEASLESTAIPDDGETGVTLRARLERIEVVTS